LPSIKPNVVTSHQQKRNVLQLTDLPIYQLLKAFKLQQYTLKMNEMGYGHDIYKLALLS